MKIIPASELIINPDGSIYHLNLRPEQLATTVITVGDPDRVSAVSKHFDRIDHQVQKREFVTHTGSYQGKQLSVISTGIGTDNIDIVFNELDALVNVDFTTRQVKTELQSLDIIRIGTSGCLQEDIPLDSFLLSSYGLGLDGLLHFYNAPHNADETMVHHMFMQDVGKKMSFPIRPYLAQGSQSLLKRFGGDMLKGITVTCPGFYAPQGRQVRAEIINENYLENLVDFQYDEHRITNFEMETAGIYGLAKVLGHQAVSCNALIANRATNSFSQTPTQTVDKLIELVLDRI
ncbi:MAG: nucleoside phosphorylase [Saprospiraceae bacterium]